MLVDKRPRWPLQEQSRHHARGEHAADAQCPIAEAVRNRDERNNVEPIADLRNDPRAKKQADIAVDEERAIVIDRSLQSRTSLIESLAGYEHGIPSPDSALHNR